MSGLALEQIIKDNCRRTCGVTWDKLSQREKRRFVDRYREDHDAVRARLQRQLEERKKS